MKAFILISFCAGLFYALAKNVKTIPSDWQQKVAQHDAFFSEDDSGVLDVVTGYPKDLYMVCELYFQRIYLNLIFKKLLSFFSFLFQCSL
jgi:hypothetical protein